MEKVRILPYEYSQARMERIIGELKNAIERGDDLGSRHVHIQYHNKVLTELINVLQHQLDNFASKEPLTQNFRVSVEALISEVRKLQQDYKMYL